MPEQRLSIVRETRQEGMRALPILSLLAVLPVGCGDGETGKTDSSPFNPNPSIYLMQVSLPLASTNTGVMPSMVLRGRNLGLDVASRLAEDLEAKALFVSADGSAVRVASITPPMGPEDYDFAVQPSAPLLMDMWYDVTYPSGPIDYPTGSIDGAVSRLTPVILPTFTSYLGEGILNRFFTGSAPQLNMVLVDEGKDGAVGTSNLLSIFLSEPVSLEDLLSGGLVVSSTPPVNGILIGCLVASHDCREPPPFPSAARSEVGSFQYLLDEAVPLHFEMALALSLRGSTRTVQEALDVGSIRGTTTVSDGYLRYPMDVSAWRQRSNGGSMFGWANVE